VDRSPENRSKDHSGSPFHPEAQFENKEHLNLNIFVHCHPGNFCVYFLKIERVVKMLYKCVFLSNIRVQIDDFTYQISKH
jgi:hypothetical protein